MFVMLVRIGSFEVLGESYSLFVLHAMVIEFSLA